MKKRNRIVLYFVGVVMLLVSSCKKDDDENAQVQTPTTALVYTLEPTDITRTSVSFIGKSYCPFLDYPIFYRGLCISDSNHIPTINNRSTRVGHGNGSFQTTFDKLMPNTTYYVRAYAINEIGIAYGEVKTFTTLGAIFGDPVQDIDGNSYNTVTIGNQVWMTENLKVTHFNNGDPIPTTSPASLNIASESNPIYQWGYDDDAEKINTYGRLYTWYVVNDSRGLCPEGWHVPIYTEQVTLSDSVRSRHSLYIYDAGIKLREAGTSHWIVPSAANNEFGFTALPGGYRDQAGTFAYLGYYGMWWINNELDSFKSNALQLRSDEDGILTPAFDKKNGLSVRCLKDVK